MLTALALAISLNLGCQPDKLCKVAEIVIGDDGGVSYGLAHYYDGTRHTLVMEARPSQSQKNVDWHEIDKLSVAIDDKKFVVEAMGLCRMDGKSDPELLAMVRPKPALYRRAVKAWRADRKQRKFVPVPVRGVDCEDESYGT